MTVGRLTGVHDPDRHNLPPPGDFPSSCSPQPLQSVLLAQFPWVQHGITRRVPGLGLADGNIGLRAPRDEDDAWAMRRLWSLGIGLNVTNLVTSRQVHGRGVRRVGNADVWGAARSTHESACADALITNEPGVALLTLHADCLPVLVVDPSKRAVASIHAGWRGTVLDVVGATIEQMHNDFGSRPEEIVAFLGPAIGPCCYDVGDEVVNAWQGLGLAAREHVIVHGEAKTRFDLRRANVELLRRAGLRRESIDVSPICTKCESEGWFSHRGQGPLTGRFGAIIAIHPDVVSRD